MNLLEETRCLGKGTLDKIFSVRQIIEKCETAGRKLYLVFVDLEKTFNRVQRRIWWALRKIVVEKQLWKCTTVSKQL